MSTETAASAKNSYAWIWQVLGLILACYVLEQDTEFLLLTLNLQPQAGSLNFSPSAAPELGPGFVTVVAFRPGSPLPAAGVSVGDHIRFDRQVDLYRVKRLGEPIGFTLKHQGRLSHKTATTAPYALLDAEKVGYDIIFNVADVISTLFGAFILWRSRSKPATMALGGALISFGLSIFNPQFWESGPSVVVMFTGLNWSIATLEPFLFVIFAMLFYQDSGGRIRREVWWALAAFGLAGLASVELAAYGQDAVVSFPVLGNGHALMTGMAYAAFVLAFGYLVAGWRRSSRDTRRRYTLLLTATSAVIVAQMMELAMESFGQGAGLRYSPWALPYDVLSGLVAPALFAYAILRHKVVDLGFAINRTLVYGVVSVVLLLGFGLIEWASEKFIPIESREKNLFIDAGIALGIFLVFHRLRDFAEKIIEDAFFRTWRDNEKDLRKFVNEGRFILQRTALMTGFVKAMKRFSGGAEVAIYLPGEGADYVLAEGIFSAIGKRLDGDDETLVSLRATRQVQETKDGTLALPMTHRNDLSGMVVIGHKPSGDSWRPDEREILAWAVVQVGHDLHALKVEQLETVNGELNQEVRALRRLIAPRGANA